MISIFARRTDAGQFRLRWLGYDRAEVDEFLRRTQADRQRLQEDLRQLETAMASHGEERRREFERLAVLRIEVASCLETSLAALRVATERLSAAPLSTPASRPACEAPTPAPSEVSPHLKWWHLRPIWLGAAPTRSPLQVVSAHRGRVLVAAGAVAAVILAAVTYHNGPGASAKSSAGMPRADRETSALVRSRGPAGPPAPVIEQMEGVVLTLTAHSTCWIGTSIDGGQPLKRMLKPDETIMLRADQEAVLRVGDAAALSLLINNRPAKPLGAAGQVVTARITRANYLSFLTNN